MEDVKQVVACWQSLLQPYQSVFTAPGWVRFAQWATGTVLCDEEHTITQIVSRMGVPQWWRVAESFAEYGVFDLPSARAATMRLVEARCPEKFGGYRPVALDDTKEQRSSRKVWGACTYKQTSSRNPKHPKIQLAHNWVEAGDLSPGEPWTYLPTGALLYMRESQLPAGETFRTKLELGASLLGEVDAASAGRVLAIFDGGNARKGLIGPCLKGFGKDRPVAILTRPRKDARLYAPVDRTQDAKRVAKKGGRPRKWGQRLPSPEHYKQWRNPWHKGRAWIYGQERSFRCKSMDCRWSVSGPEDPVRVYVFEVEGYAQPWFLVTSALDLSEGEAVEGYAARFRQEDGFRDHKQQMGMEEVRAWTKQPVLRTYMVQLIAMTLMRLLMKEATGKWGSWYAPPAWNRRKKVPSLRDMRRLLWDHREGLINFLRELDEVRKPRLAAA